MDRRACSATPILQRTVIGQIGLRAGRDCFASRAAAQDDPPRSAFSPSSSGGGGAELRGHRSGGRESPNRGETRAPRHSTAPRRTLPPASCPSRTKDRGQGTVGETTSRSSMSYPSHRETIRDNPKTSASRSATYMCRACATSAFVFPSARRASNTFAKICEVSRGIGMGSLLR